MFTELLYNLSGDLAMGLAQAAGSIVLCLGVVLTCRRFAVHVEREAAVAEGARLKLLFAANYADAPLLHGAEMGAAGK